MDLIVAHTRTDFDALASTVAAARLFEGATPLLQSHLDAGVAAFVATHKDALGLKRADEIDFACIRRVIVVDTQRPERLGDASQLLAREDIEWVVYDHHPNREGDLIANHGETRTTGACVTLLIEALRARGCSLSPIEATTLALGIYADTGNFRYPGTSAEDLEACAHLLRCGADLALIQHYTERRLTPKQGVLLEVLRTHGKTTMLGQYRLFIAACPHDRHVDGLALIAERLMDEWHADLLAIAVTMRADVVNLVARSRLPALDLREGLKTMHVKGHPGAVSAVLRDQSIDDVAQSLYAAFVAAVPPTPRAVDMMSSPVRVVGASATLAEAGAQLERLGHSAVLVTDENGAMKGILSRRDIMRGLRHGLANAPVTDWMTRQVISIDTECPLDEIERLMGKHDIGRAPVLKHGAVVGIVTRSDVLRIRYGQTRTGSEVIKHTQVAVTERMAAAWEKVDMDLLEAIARLSQPTGVYLVGGAVRDLLLERVNPDLDLVVEGAAVTLARAFAKTLPNSQLHVHEAVGTARVHLPGDRQLDFASARTEFYSRPGAVPEVAFSSLKQDLARRDFTINCLAIQLSPAPFGQLLDFFNALTDLENKHLRVLHNLSFVEDPSRILRAVRFEHQLGFHLEPQSDQLARATLRNRQFAGFGSKRVMQELQRILSLSDPLRACQRLSDLGAWCLIHPDLHPDTNTWRALRLARRLAVTLTLNPTDQVSLYLSILLDPLDLSAQEQALRGLQLSKQAWSSLLAPARIRHEWPRAKASASHIYRLLRGMDDWAILALMITGRSNPIRAWVRRFRREWRHQSLSLTGADLLAKGIPPGPRYTQLLDALLEAKLLAPLPDRAAEEAWLTNVLRLERSTSEEDVRGSD